MSRYDGLIIPRSYSEYINKTDAATLSQALQLGGVLDSAPTEDSVKAVKSGGVFDALAGKQPTLTFDNVPTEDSDNPVKSGGIYDALATKQNTLTFDDTPTADSNNPVKSSGLVNSVPVNEVTGDNMHAVTSNAVANALSYSETEHIVGKYFGNTLYARTFQYNNVTSNTGQGTLLQADFPITQSKIAKIEFTKMVKPGATLIILQGSVYINGQELYVYQEISSGTYTVLITVYYIK